MQTRNGYILGATLLLLGLSNAAHAQILIPDTPAGSGQIEAQSVGTEVEAVPNAPTNLTAVATSSTEVHLTWKDNATDEIEYRVEAKTGTGSFVDIGSIPANSQSVNVAGLNPGTTYVFRVRASNANGGSPYSNEATATTFSTAGTCTPSATAICLNNNRFRVEALYETKQGQSGSAHGVKLTEDSGYLWFFAASNIEVVVKVLNGCGTNNHYWVFAGGLTNVRVVLIVTDTKTGATNTYVNPQGAPFQPIQQTGAFATCP
jgi:FlaG/FlaF family flagellin (archaellin)